MAEYEMYLPRHLVLTPRIVTALIVIAAITAVNSHAESSLGHELKPQLGSRITGHTDTIYSPDGSNLPNGNVTVKEGQTLYVSQCAACHGIDGQQAGNALVGGIGSLTSQRPVRTVGSYWPYASTLYDYIARAMPYNKQKSLSADEVYAVTAYVLMLNGILDDDDSLNPKSLTEVKMPNRAGFKELIQ